MSGHCGHCSEKTRNLKEIGGVDTFFIVIPVITEAQNAEGQNVEII
jgi:hypothetical protein